MSTYAPTFQSSYQPTLRLTRRGRLVLFLLGLAVVLALGVVWGAGSVAGTHAGPPEPTPNVHGQPGQTLYAIAETVTTDGDVAAMVEKIMDLNALDDPMLYVGQSLRVPVN